MSLPDRSVCSDGDNRIATQPFTRVKIFSSATDKIGEAVHLSKLFDFVSESHISAREPPSILDILAWRGGFFVYII